MSLLSSSAKREEKWTPLLGHWIVFVKWIVRKAMKARFQGEVTYWQGDYIHGVASAKNLGHGDIALRLNRGLAPGDSIQLELDCLTYRGLPIAMEG